MFKFPYFLSFLKKPFRNTKLLFFIYLREISKKIKFFSKKTNDLPFSIIMSENIYAAQNLYKKKKCSDLLKKILLEFCDEAYSNNHIPIMLIIPQLIDIKFIKKNGKNLSSIFFNNMKKEKYFENAHIINLTDVFLNSDFKKMYVHDSYGGHLSEIGNDLVARELKKYFKKNIPLLG